MKATPWLIMTQQLRKSCSSVMASWTCWYVLLVQGAPSLALVAKLRKSALAVRLWVLTLKALSLLSQRSLIKVMCHSMKWKELDMILYQRFWVSVPKITK